eukprot:5662601-Pleurochrysis_carterae.AAC.2
MRFDVQQRRASFILLHEQPGLGAWASARHVFTRVAALALESPSPPEPIDLLTSVRSIVSILLVHVISWTRDCSDLSSVISLPSRLPLLPSLRNSPATARFQEDLATAFSMEN